MWYILTLVSSCDTPPRDKQRNNIEYIDRLCYELGKRGFVTAKSSDLVSLFLPIFIDLTNSTYRHLETPEQLPETQHQVTPMREGPSVHQAIAHWPSP